MVQLLQERLGPLDCRIVAAGEEAESSEEANVRRWAAADLIVVLCHGFGAPGDDLVPLGQELLHAHPAWQGRVSFVFPAAPIVLERFGSFESRAWWPIDMERMLITNQEKLLERLRNEAPPELPQAKAKLQTLLRLITDDNPAHQRRIVLGGFSQGAMLATETGLSQPPETPFAGLALFSGTLLNEAHWKQLAEAARPLPILQSHGTQDPILPYANAEKLRELLVAAGHPVDFISFAGPHAIPPAALEGLAHLLQAELTRLDETS